MKKALEGIKVVDLTSALSGPFCTMMLAELWSGRIKNRASTRRSVQNMGSN